MLDVLAIGETVIDFTPIGTSPAGNPIYEAQPGGAPSNMLAEASKLGAKTALIGMVGRDPLGLFLHQVLIAYGIGAKGVKITEQAPTVFTLVDHDKRGDRTFFSLQNRTVLNVFSVEDIDFDGLEDTKILHIAGSLLCSPNGLEIIQKAKKYAASKGIPVCCDVNWRPYTYDRDYAQKVLLPYLAHLDILKISWEELELFTDTFDLKEGCQKFSELGTKLTAVSMGAKGCYFSYANGSGHLPTYDVKVVDTNASGDSFTGALLVELSKLDLPVEKIPLEQMRAIMDFANAAGAACAAHSGAICAVPTREQGEMCRERTPMLFPKNLSNPKE